MVQLFAVNITSCLERPLDEALHLLTPERREKVQRYKSVNDAWLSLFSELLVRFVAYEKYGLEEGQFGFYKNDQGKPFLYNDPFQFNTSHSGDWVVLAVSENSIGVDVEQKRPMRRLLALAKRFFSSTEQAYINEDSDSVDSFFKIWTMKESYLKCTGTGIAYSLSSFSVPVGEGEQFKAGKWQFLTKSFEKQYKIAVCVEGEDEIDSEVHTMKGAELIEFFSKRDNADC